MAKAAMRAAVPGGDEALRDALLERARQLGLLGWVRHDAPDGAVRIHVEGEGEAVAALRELVAPHAEEERAKVEGHEQLVVRGVPHGVFVVQEHAATAHHFDLRLEVGGVMRSWALPKGPTLDPAVKRLAVEVGDHSLAYNAFEGRTGSGGGVVIWDRGPYEQGGRVAWPEALDRGHAVFVLHGEKLRGGFVLQRTRGRGEKAQWLLLKRRDDEARPGSDVTAEQPRSVESGRTLDELLGR
ncbi:MAG TPA: DNA polymerase ligase N-terminal domain-containing protein [Solirubrobacteraceae bacterium]|nr:DNA polymerase ligase N-terminal domain-containing protein [Solirubrobacteraceae bacterium]